MTIAPGTPAAAGDPVFASDINALLNALTPMVTTTVATIGTVATGFTVNDARASVIAFTKTVDLDLYLNVTTVINSVSSGSGAIAGNITDTLCFTLNTAFRPSHPKSMVAGNGEVVVEAIVNTDGTINLRATSSAAFASAAIKAASNLRFSTSYQIG